MPDAVAARMLRGSIGRSLRTGLASVAVAGELPSGAAVLAPTHASWWDGYLVPALAGAVGATASVMMSSEQLDRFPFLRLVGAVGPDGARVLVRRAGEGQWAVVFPQGQLRPGSELGPVLDGAAWVARTARVPLVPVALRVVVRGDPRPEAFLNVGRPIVAAGAAAARSTAGLTRLLAERLTALQADLDGAIAVADPERPLPGYRTVLRGSGGRRDDDGAAVRLLARLTRDDS